MNKKTGLRRKLILATLAGAVFGALVLTILRGGEQPASPDPVAEAEVKPPATAPREPASVPTPVTASTASPEPDVSAAPPEPAEFSCLSHLHDQIEDYDLFIRRLDRSTGSRVGTWYFYHDEDLSQVHETSASGLFLSGLANAGLLQGSPAPPDIPRAIRELKRAHRLDPKNSAPLIYLAYLADQRDKPKLAAKYRAKIAKTTRFDSYILSVANQVYGMVESPSDYMNAKQVWSSAPVPDYMVLRKYLIDHHLPKVADQMIAAQNFEGEQDLDFFFVEGATGVSTIKKLQPERESSLPSMQAVVQRMKEDRSSLLWDEIPEKDCHLSFLDPEVEKLRARRRAPTPSRN